MAGPFVCPGQDQRYLRPEDVCELACPRCGAKVELWKDDPYRDCRKCGERVKNPKLDPGCAQWCKFAADCLGKEVQSPESKVQS